MREDAPRYVSALWRLHAMNLMKENICVISVGYCIAAEMELLLSMINKYARLAQLARAPDS